MNSVTTARATAQARAQRAWEHPRTPWLVLAALSVLAFVTIRRAADGLFFFGDEWAFLLHRRGVSLETFFAPHNEHPSAVPVFAYKAQLAVFGMTSVTPFQVLVALMHIATGIVVFLYARRRVGAHLALVPAALMIFLGAAWEDVMWPFQIGFIGSVLFGIVALLALDDRRDWLACAALVLSTMSSGLGLPFLGIALIEILWDERRWRRVWVIVVPALLVAVSLFGYGGGDHGSLTSPSAAVRWGVDMVAAGFGGFGALGIDWGRPLMLAAGIAFVLGVRSGRVAVGPRLVALLLGLAACAMLIGSGRAGLQQAPDTSRYVHISAALLLLIAVTALGRTAVTRSGGLAIAAVTALACFASLSVFKDGPFNHRVNAEPLKMQLAALELRRNEVAPGVQVGAPALGIRAVSYFSATDKFGSPAPTLDEVRAAPDEARQVFDGTLAGLDQLALTPATGGAGGTCSTTAPGQEAELAPGARYRFTATGAGALKLRRLATTVQADATPWALPDGTPLELALTGDALPEPWRAAITGASVRVCRVG
ncbi:hypothetical protein DVA67_015755 [Solirubrobacter sp. CPCC 204708]|uniref:Glycosyltransferase RgtA/B/C/D-like domain-containing protein n=1 Tax=Solirubrobacter deserti TaxID=2282478 RepID=A0ABT4RP06_9ACTN|nr:hypothetical protein [Solirubrobacter deserti]MBE2317438.1 hypothetical protein [Solirubrobacter deserti]MDA0140020.1 hypothetical protein [Solirubrobacter deserti]